MFKFVLGAAAGTLVGMILAGEYVAAVYKQDGSLSRIEDAAADYLRRQGKRVPQYSRNVHEENMEMLRRWSQGDFSDH